MKIYFTTPTNSFVADFAIAADEPECVASFTLTKKQSTFAPRYALVDGKLVDNYSGKTDEEVAASIKQLNDDAAAALAEASAANT